MSRLKMSKQILYFCGARFKVNRGGVGEDKQKIKH